MRAAATSQRFDKRTHGWSSAAVLTPFRQGEIACSAIRRILAKISLAHAEPQNRLAASGVSTGEFSENICG
jgi:hypothetical protein